MVPFFFVRFDGKTVWLSQQQIAELFGVGQAAISKHIKNLEAIRPELSVEENIRQLCFMPHGLLFREFDETFSNVFGRRIMSRAKMLRAILNDAKSVSEFADETEVSPSGGQTKVLDDLVLAGFTGLSTRSNARSPDSGG